MSVRADSNSAISVRNIWKIFGDRYEEAYKQIQENNLSKKQVLELYNCVVGVADVSFDVEPGQIYCIMGLSGSGKSTLVRHINRLLEPSYGTINVNGRDIMKLNFNELQKFRNDNIAMVFQNFALMPHRSVLDNIAMPLEIRGVSKNKRLEKAQESLELVELTGWGNKYAHELSGGMQQRIGLARALTADPEILLMDEPFSALDPLIRRQLQDQFMQLASKVNKTTIFITHDLDEAVRVGDKIAIMRDGRLIQEATPENIVMHPADDYIAEFVAGISRLKVVKARAVMQPIQSFENNYGILDRNLDGLHQFFNEDDSLSTLIKAVLDQDKPLIVKNNKGLEVGVITSKDLLKTVIEGTETG